MRRTQEPRHRSLVNIQAGFNTETSLVQRNNRCRLSTTTLTLHFITEHLCTLEPRSNFGNRSTSSLKADELQQQVTTSGSGPVGQEPRSVGVNGLNPWTQPAPCQQSSFRRCWKLRVRLPPWFSRLDTWSAEAAYWEHRGCERMNETHRMKLMWDQLV